MFNKESRMDKIKKAETIIGSSIKVKGNFNGQGDIIIEGVLEGSLKTESNVFIGEQAKINANIEALEVLISGEVSGNIKVKKYLAISKTAHITGDIQCGEISIERGAKITGLITVLTSEEKSPEVKKSKEKEEKSA